MSRLIPLTMFAALALCDYAHADLVFTGIVEDVTVTRMTLPGGLLDSLVIKVDVGSNTFTALEGGFQPIASTFNQNNPGSPDATPPKILFDLSLIPPDDTTFLLTRDLGDPDGEGLNTDTTSELSTPSFNYTMPRTGMFELARLVVPTGADAMVIGTFLPGTITFVQSAMPIGTISGTTVIPEASVVAAWLLLTGAAVMRWKRQYLLRLFKT